MGLLLCIPFWIEAVIQMQLALSRDRGNLLYSLLIADGEVTSGRTVSIRQENAEYVIQYAFYVYKPFARTVKVNREHVTAQAPSFKVGNTVAILSNDSNSVII